MDEKLIKKIEEIIGYTLPNNFKNFYLDLKSNEIFMSLDDIYYEEVNEITNDLKSSNLFTSMPENAILLKAYDGSNRVAFIKDDCGNFIGFDYNPGTEGIIGQIIKYGRDIYDMEVLAYDFESFLNGLKSLNIDKEHIVYYMFDEKINFRKDKIQDKSIEKLSSSSFNNKIKISESKICEETKQVIINEEYLRKIVSILLKMNQDIKIEDNVKKVNPFWFNYRIINKKDSLSRTMGNDTDFYLKLRDYNKDEIKGFSFAVSNYIEQQKEENILYGEEKIFVEINIISNTALVRYSETIGNQTMKNAYDKICTLLDSLK